MQRARALRNHEDLLRKYNQKGGGGDKPEKKKEKTTTFAPKLSEGEDKNLTGKCYWKDVSKGKLTLRCWKYEQCILFILFTSRNRS
jgi:hypothetical protein